MRGTPLASIPRGGAGGGVGRVGAEEGLAVVARVVGGLEGVVEGVGVEGGDLVEGGGEELGAQVHRGEGLIHAGVGGARSRRGRRGGSPRAGGRRRRGSRTAEAESCMKSHPATSTSSEAEVKLICPSWARKVLMRPMIWSGGLHQPAHGEVLEIGEGVVGGGGDAGGLGGVFAVEVVRQDSTPGSPRSRRGWWCSGPLPGVEALPVDGAPVRHPVERDLVVVPHQLDVLHIGVGPVDLG